jgi:hypothetical protein
MTDLSLVWRSGLLLALVEAETSLLFGRVEELLVRVTVDDIPETAIETRRGQTSFSIGDSFCLLMLA